MSKAIRGSSLSELLWSHKKTLQDMMWVADYRTKSLQAGATKQAHLPTKLAG